MMASPSLPSCAGDMMACDESPKSGSCKLDEDGGGAPPIELYVGTLPVGGVVAGGGAFGTTPYLLRSPESDGACAAAVDTSGSLVIGVTASANATNGAVHTPARPRDTDLAR